MYKRQPKIPAVSPQRLAYPRDEAVEAQCIASIHNHAQRLHSQAQLTPVIWKAKITNLGHPKTIYCRHSHLWPDALRYKQWRAFDKGTFVEHVLPALKISGIGPQCFSHQYETQQKSSNKIIHVLAAGSAAFTSRFSRLIRTTTRNSLVLRYGYVRLRFLRKSGQNLWRIPSRSGRKHPSQ